MLLNDASVSNVTLSTMQRPVAKWAVKSLIPGMRSWTWPSHCSSSCTAPLDDLHNEACQTAVAEFFGQSPGLLASALRSPCKHSFSFLQRKWLFGILHIRCVFQFEFPQLICSYQVSLEAQMQPCQAVQNCSRIRRISLPGGIPVKEQLSSFLPTIPPLKILPSFQIGNISPHSPPLSQTIPTKKVPPLYTI